MHIHTLLVLLALQHAAAGPLGSFLSADWLRKQKVLKEENEPCGYEPIKFFSANWYRKQKILKKEDKPCGYESTKKFAAPVQSFEGVIHTMNITIGTPPQHFNVSLDVTSNAFFVPSIDCDDACRWWMPMHSYTANESSTYEPNGTSAVNDYWGDRYRGHLVRDTVRFGELEASNMTFLPFDERNTVSILGWDVGFDGLMGLAPPWNRYRHEYYPQEYPNFLEYVDQKKLVDEKVFSLALPRGLDDRGEFMLGGTNPNLYRGSFQTVKLLNDSDISHPYKGLWNIPIESITLNTSIPYHLPLNSNYTAAIVSEPIIILPTNFTRDLNKIIGATPFNWLWDAIPCDRRPYLPQLTFSIGGHNLTIDAFDYTFEFELPYGFAPACLTWFGAEDQYGYGDSTVVLGNTFLKGFYTRFDWGKREVGFAEVRR